VGPRYWPDRLELRRRVKLRGLTDINARDTGMGLTELPGFNDQTQIGGAGLNFGIGQKKYREMLGKSERIFDPQNN
jgi:hypothetical protein